MTTATADLQTLNHAAIAQGIKVLFDPSVNRTVEMRGIRREGPPSTHFYTDLEVLATDLAKFDTDDRFKGLYYTVQQLKTGTENKAKGKTADEDIECYRWLYIDVDSQRPANTNASDEEKDAAWEVASKVAVWLEEQGFPAPVTADSGNGYHFHYRIDLEASASHLVKRCLEALAARFNTPGVHVDVVVYNPSRITKAYGTLARKGPNTSERPWRRSGLGEVPDKIEVTSRVLLEALAAMAPVKHEAASTDCVMPSHNVEARASSKIPAGTWHQVLTSQAGRFVNSGIRSEAALTTMLLAFANERFAKVEAWTKPDADLRRIIQDAATKFQGAEQPKDDPPPQHWRDVFHTGAELNPAPSKVYIKGILEEGVVAFGGLSQVGKTWIGLSISHALITGEKLFGVYPVINRTNVLYLVPEMGTGKFRERMVKMRISMDGWRVVKKPFEVWQIPDGTLTPDEEQEVLLDSTQVTHGGFYCQTLADGVCNLADPLLIEALHNMRPTVILDTAIRFRSGDDENQASDNASGLAAALFNLRKHGSPLIIAMHHRSKATRGESLTLENTLRGSGDFGAMCDIVWGVEHDCRRLGNSDKIDEDYFKESVSLTRLHLECVKGRDMECADSFRIQGRNYINEIGDFRVLTQYEDKNEPACNEGEVAKLNKAIKDDSKVGIRALCGALSCGHVKLERLLKENKWARSSDGTWQREKKSLEDELCG